MLHHIASRKNIFLLSLLSAGLYFPGAHATEETTDPYEDRLFAHWGGQRDRLADVGVDVTLEYKADMWQVISGGIKKGGNYLDNLDMQFAFDGAKLFGLPGNKMFVYFINNNGGHPNMARIGSQQGIDNIEVVKDSPKLYEAWVDQSFFDGKLSVLAGLHDLNAEFDQTDSTANFLKPAMQIGQEFSQSGANGPAIFPNTAPALRVKVAPTQDIYIQGAVFDGIAGDPDHLYGNHLKFDGGALLVAETGYTPPAHGDGQLNKLAMGAWGYTKKMEDLADVSVRSRSAGAYALSSCQCFYDKASGHSLTVFFRPGIADGDTKPIDWSYVTGVVGHGWIASRPDSEIGLGLSQAHNSRKALAALEGPTPARSEYGVELYYRDRLYPGIALQPDLQYVANPGIDPQEDNAWVIGARIDINF